jgi:hypothetical protein
MLEKCYVQVLSDSLLQANPITDNEIIEYHNNKEYSQMNTSKFNSYVKKFIERPVLSTVISIILLLLGTLSLFNLPITLFPDIAPPSVQVTAFIRGQCRSCSPFGSQPIEEAVNGVENMTYMTSNSSNDGTMT